MGGADFNPSNKSEAEVQRFCQVSDSTGAVEPPEWLWLSWWWWSVQLALSPPLLPLSPVLPHVCRHSGLHDGDGQVHRVRPGQQSIPSITTNHLILLEVKMWTPADLTLPSPSRWSPPALRQDIPGVGTGVGSREIGYLYGQYKRTNVHHAQKGKGLLWGGVYPFPQASAWGVVHFARKVRNNGAADALGLPR